MAKNYIYKEGEAFPYQYKYEHMAVTTDCVIFAYEDRRLKVLLVCRGEEPFKGEWAFPGGFLKMDETAREGAMRELKEETGLETSSIRELGVFSAVDRDPRERVVTVAFYALVRPSAVRGGDDAVEANWFDIAALPRLAFDHQAIFDAAMERLRRDIHFESVGFDLLDETFTIPDLQNLYEIILGTSFDRRNFQRKIMSSGILEEMPGHSSAVCETNIAYLVDDSAPLGSEPSAAAPPKRRPGRIAALFRFNKAKYDELKERGDKFEW